VSNLTQFVNILKSLLNFDQFKESISEAAVKKFCKEAANLKLHRDSGSIADELSGRISPTRGQLVTTLEQNPDSEAIYYLILRYFNNNKLFISANLWESLSTFALLSGG
jgi:hypothetical protein